MSPWDASTVQGKSFQVANKTADASLKYIVAVRSLNGKLIQSHVKFVILRSMFTFFVPFMHEALDFSSLRII